jgi:hypothetical protein
MSNSAAHHDLIKLLQKIAPTGPWVTCTISTQETDPKPKKPKDLTPDGALDWVSDAEARKNNCYIHAAIAKESAAGKARLAKADVGASHCAWTDVDPDPQRYEETRAAILAAMRAEQPPFSCIVDSGNGFQAYKFYDAEFTIAGEADIAKQEAVNRAINESLNAKLASVDVKADSCHSVDHLMRAPGTTNFMTAKKREKGYPEGDRPARIVDWNPEHVYPITDLPSVEAQRRSRGPEETISNDRSPPILSLVDQRLVAVALDVMEIIRTGSLPSDMKAGHAHFKVVAELTRAGLSDANVKQVYKLGPLGNHVSFSSRGFDGYLDKTIKAARSHGDAKLFEMNAQHCVMCIGGKTRVITWGEDTSFPGRKTIVSTSSFTDFRNLYDKYRHEYQQDGETISTRLGSWWLGQPHRSQYDGGMKFMPQRKEEVIGNVMNMWQGFAVEARKPAGGSGASGCSLFLDHGLKVVCSGNEQHYDYLIKREAYIAQKRTRSEIALALRTETEGTGKGFWCRSINHLYGQHAMHVQNTEHVIGKFNPHLETLLKLTADEALFAGDPRHRNALYYLITEPTVPIEPKFINTYNADNHLNLDIISNARHFIPVSGTARRFFVPTVSSDRANNHGYFREIENQLNDGGHEALLYHLLYEIDLRDFNVRDVPKTAALAEQAAYSRKDIDLLVEIACNSARVPCAYYKDYPDFSQTDGQSHRSGFDYFIDHNVDRRLAQMGALMVKRRLVSDWGCVTGKDARRTIARDRHTGIVWPPLEELRAKFEKKYGKQDWQEKDETKWMWEPPPPM